LPKGKYVIQVNVLMNPSEEVDYANFKLPMGTISMSEKDIPVTSTSQDPLVMANLISKLKKVDIQVGVQQDVASNVREMIRSYLVSGLGLNPVRGDLVTVNDLPQGITDAWKTIKDEVASYDVKTPIYMMGGIVIICMGLLIFGMIFAFGRLSNKLSNETKTLSNSLKEAIENQNPQPSFQPNLGNQKTSSLNREPEQIIDFWKRVDVDQLYVFSLDCFDIHQYQSAAMELVNFYLDSEKAKELEGKIPGSYLTQTFKNKIGEDEIKRLLLSNQAEYRRIVKSPIGQVLLPISSRILLLERESMQKTEINLLINSMTPLKRGEFLKGLSPAFKMELVQESKHPLTALEHKTFEVSLLKKLEKFKAMDQIEETSPMSYLSGVILKATSFTEDQDFYEQNSEQYQSILKSLKLFNQDDWSAFNLDQISLAFYGYSESYLNKLYSFYPGKQGEWLKNFIAKRQKEANSFDHPQVEAIHELIKEKIKSLELSSHRLSA
jgi:hypothetical protein